MVARTRFSDTLYHIACLVLIH